jgi:transcriptional regulator with XRE-family HTH domain
LDQGLTITQIAREAGTEPATVRRLINGQKTVLAVTAQKILSVPLNVRVSLGDVSALGAVRRLRALYALGHLNWVISQESGLSRDAVCDLVNGSWTTIKVAADDGVRAAYDRLSMKTGTSWKTRKLAERNGWAPPLAWDDDTIDDPKAMPVTDAAPPAVTEGDNVASRWLMGESVILGPQDRKEVLAYLFEWTNDTTAEIADRLDMSPKAAEQAWGRLKRQARAEGRRLYRRAYITRERTLNQNEMEEAA